MEAQITAPYHLLIISAAKQKPLPMSSLVAEYSDEVDVDGDCVV